jgi:outer membrane protein assembly factor BamB
MMAQYSRLWLGRGQLLITLAATLAAAGCWPAPGQNADRTGHNAFETAITPGTVSSLTVSWTAPVDGGAVGAPVRGSDQVYVADDVALYGFDASTGARRWASSFDRIAGAPWVKGDVYLVSDHLVVSDGYEAFGGSYRTRWVDQATGAAESTGRDVGIVAAIRDRLAVGVHAEVRTDIDPSYHLWTLDLVPGTWTPTDRGLISYGFGQSPGGFTVGRDRIYGAGVGTLPPYTTQGGVLTFDHLGNGVRAFDRDQSNACANPDPLLPPWDCGLWATPTDGFATAPVIGPDEATLYVGTDAGTVYAVDAANGAILWSASAGAAVEHPPALAGGLLYVPTADGDLVVFDVDACGGGTCSPAWSAPSPGPISAQPAVAGGVVFVGTASGALRAFDAGGCGAATCVPLWSAETGSAITGDPAVSSGHVFAGTADGRLIAYHLAS